jgi:hypothetical protein
MFCDTISDALSSILDDLRPDYALPDVYPKETVIQTIMMLRYLDLLSVCSLPSGGYANNHNETSLKNIAYRQAVILYNEKMGLPFPVES